MLRGLDYLPTVPLAIATVVLALSPPFSEPHLLSGLKLLVNGERLRPIDIFDLFLHASLPVVLVLKFLRIRDLGRSNRK